MKHKNDSLNIETERLWSIYLDLGSVHKVGEQVGLSGDTVHQRFVKAGYKLRNPRWTEWELSTLRAYYADTADEDFLLEDAARLVGRDRIAVALKASRLGLGVRDRSKSTEAISRLSESIKQAWRHRGHPRGMAGKKHSGETRLRLGQASRARWLTDKTFGIGLFSDAARQRLSDSMQARQANPESNLRRGYSRGKAGRREDIGNRHFRSSWEANYARYLCWLQGQGQIAKWEFEPDTFWFDAIKRGVRSYLPDFKVWPADGGDPYYVEIKGYMDAKSRTKLKRMKKYHPNVTIKLVDAKSYKILDNRMRGVIPGWEGGTRVLLARTTV